MADAWTEVVMPLYAEEDNDVLGRQHGELLWDRFSEADFPSVERGEITARSFAALYQQRPAPADGSLFKMSWMMRRWTVLPRLKRAVMFVDGAWKEGVQNDFSAIAVWATDGIDFYLVYAWHGRHEYPELKQKVVDTYERFRNHLGVKPALCVEDAASGMALVQELKRTTRISVIGVPAKGSKYARAEAITLEFEAGRVVLPATADWLDAWIDEHLRFPSAAHDDWVDTTSGALGRFQSKRDNLTPEFYEWLAYRGPVISYEAWLELRRSGKQPAITQASVDQHNRFNW